MPGYNNKINVWGRLLPVLAVCLLLTGCQLRPPLGINGMENQRLKEAEAAFFQKDYSRSAMVFQEIFNLSRNPELKNAAYYGLICTGLMTAENRKAVYNALSELKKWAPQDRDAPHIENPELMALALGKLTREARVEAARSSLKIKKMARTHREEMETLKSIRKELQDKIFQLETAMETLLHQISELETIDQDIQKKRKPL